MKVLMFGWEYPPHVFGGLATANFGISQGLHALIIAMMIMLMAMI